MKKDTSKLIDRDTLKSIIEDVVSGVESELVKSSVKKSIENLSHVLKGKARDIVEGVESGNPAAVRIAESVVDLSPPSDEDSHVDARARLASELGVKTPSERTLQTQSPDAYITRVGRLSDIEQRIKDALLSTKSVEEVIKGSVREAIERLQGKVPGDPSFNRLEAVAEGGTGEMAKLVGAETPESVAATRGEAAGEVRAGRLVGLGKKLGEEVDKVRANVEDEKPGFNTRYDEP